MRFLIKKVITLVKPYTKWEIFGVFLTAVFSVSVFLVPLASQYLIDEVIPGNSTSKLVYGILAFTFICFLQPVIGYLKDRLFVRITEGITRDIRNGLFEKIVYSNFKFLNKVKGGDLIAIIMNDGRGASDFISTIFATLFKNILMIAMILIGMCFISVDITLIVIALFVIYYLFSLLYGKKIQNVSKNIQENYDELCSCVNQTNSAILSIKTYSQETAVINRFRRVTAKMKKDNTKIDSMSLLINNLSMVAVSLCLAIIYGWGAVKVMNGSLSIGEVIALGLYFQLLNQPFFELMNIGINTNAVIPIFTRLEKYQNLEQEHVGENEGIIAFERITFSDVSYSYEEEGSNPVLTNISLNLPSKGLVSIVGESGSGKSTFTKLLLGVLKTDNGKILIGEKDINGISISTLRSNISYVPQDADILNDTINNNIRFGTNDVSDEEIQELCKKLRLHNKIMTLENGYRSVITERVNLSGGEKQRILIARGILKKAPIMILDEPLSALDSENIEIVNKIIMDIAKERLVIMITHHEFDSLIPNMTILFDGGKAKIIE